LFVAVYRGLRETLHPRLKALTANAAKFLDHVAPFATMSPC
jgi:hypothetical protein